MRYFFVVLGTLICSLSAVGQYAPQAGITGTTAIPYTSGQFVRWADKCTLQRGYMNIDSPALGLVSYGDSTMALGIADASVVSLGDSGVATVSFPGLIYNGPGPDFAIFENGFINPANDSQAYLELAFVEVSSDGVHFQRFPVNSLTPAHTQIAGTGQYMFANLINGFAGKYNTYSGTPFDLEDLPVAPFINKSAIMHIRIVDVIGSVSGHSSLDSSGRIINDPYPTQFPTGGFDLDAVGIIHYVEGAGIPVAATNSGLELYPQPATNDLYINVASTDRIAATLTDMSGRVLSALTLVQGHNTIALGQYPSGIYLLITRDNNGTRCVDKVIKR